MRPNACKRLTRSKLRFIEVITNRENIIQNIYTHPIKDPLITNHSLFILKPTSAKADLINPSLITKVITTVTIDNDTLGKTIKHDTKITATHTTCPYCGVGCGVVASVNNVTGDVSVKGDVDHPANFGKLCSKGNNLAETLGTQRRLTQPYYQDKSITMQPHLLSQADQGLIKQEADWDTILDEVADRLSHTITEHGPESVMFYVSGQLLTEDYYVANKFMKGFIGSNNIDSNSRLCMSSAVAGHKRAFGADLVPGSYTDFEDCDLLVLVGSNMAWCHPILFARFLEAKQKDPNKKLIVIDPRRTASCEFADLHLPITPGSDTHLYNGLLKFLHDQNLEDTTYSAKCEGVASAVAAAQPWDIEAVAKATQLKASQIEIFYQLIAQHKKIVTAFSMGVNQSSSGTDKVNAIINTHLLTGRVGKTGMGPFSLTGQPNAMGGREVGALANLLAAHLELDNVEHRQVVGEFWQTPQPIAPNVGVKACEVADKIRQGKIKAIWIVATNPVVSLPDADKFRKALGECELVIVSECSKDSDTLRCADIVFPAQTWGEKSGTVTNSERRISRQRGFLPPVGASKPDWWIFSQIAKRMGFQGFEYTRPSDIFLEYAALTSYKSNEYPRHLNLMAELKKQGQSYQSMRPLQWGGQHIDMIRAAYKHTAPHLIPIIPPKTTGVVNKSSEHEDKNYPSHCKNNNHPLAHRPIKQGLALILNTGRLRDQWHTMTRTALAPQLNQQQTMPTLTLHPMDAEKLKVNNAEFVSVMADNQLSADFSKVMGQVQISNEGLQGQAFMPMHWSDAFSSCARVGTLIRTKVDPISSQPELKNAAILVKRLNIKSVGRILVHPEWLHAVLVQLRLLNKDPKFKPLIWSLSRQKHCVLIDLATDDAQLCHDWLTLEYWQKIVEAAHGYLANGLKPKPFNFEQTSPIPDNAVIDHSVIVHPSGAQLRYVVHYKAAEDNLSQVATQLILALYIAPKLDQLPAVHWLNECFYRPNLTKIPSVKWLLAGRPATGYIDPGPLVCACMGVGENVIIEAIVDKGGVDATAVGKLCQAGTNCGSCVGQINKLIKVHGDNKSVEQA